MRNVCKTAAVLIFSALLAVSSSLVAGENYADYIKTSKDFERVKQDKSIELGNKWDHWVLMPWRYNWGASYDSALAGRMKAAGFNGAFCDGAARADADIHEEHGFLWYMDHSAGKGDLHLREKDSGKENRQKGNRPISLADASTIARLKDLLDKSIGGAKKFETRAAYALDDEVSWTTFTSPAKWDNSPATIKQFQEWLTKRYGSKEDCLTAWGDQKQFWDRMANPDDYQDLYKQPISKWNLAPWCDAMSFMDSQFNNLVGDLVTHANKLDPKTPVGYVGGQCPAPYGGFDYAKAMRKLQFLEAYDIGGSMEIVRSFNPDNLVPTVKTGFEADPASANGQWFFWYYLAHGDRGNIYWAEEWFSNKKPEASLMKTGAVVKSLAEVSKRTTVGAKWKHDGVGLFYSHPSIQVSWFIDSEPHGKTWINRSSSMNNALASTVGITWAWQKLLEDMHLQYNWISYADLLEKGIDPKEYKILILPRTLCLSTDEVKVLTEYVNKGGHLLADHMTGLFDQHGKAWPKPVLDTLFGVKKNPELKSGEDTFSGGIYSEIDGDKFYNKNFLVAGNESWAKCTRAKGLVVANRNAETFTTTKTGAGQATLMNVSIMEYCKIRSMDSEKCAEFIKPVSDLILASGVKAWVKLSVNGKEPDIAEATYWEKDGRVTIFVIKNPIKFASEFGATATEGVSEQSVQLKITLDKPVTKARDEMANKDLPDGATFTVTWKLCEAAAISFQK